MQTRTVRAYVAEVDGTDGVVDVELGEPRADEVVVLVEGCGVCHSDLSVIDSGVTTPTVLGHEAAGVIDAVGAAVTHVRVGQRVVISPLAPCGACYFCARDQPTLCRTATAALGGTREDGSSTLRSSDGTAIHRGLGIGGFAEATVVNARQVVPLDDHTDPRVACILACAVQTGAGAVFNTASVTPGSTVLITGLGAVGLSAVQAARIAGATTILVSDPNTERLATALDMGATHDVTDDPAAAAVELTGVGVDVAFEAAGIASLVGVCLDAIRPGGTAVVIGADATLATVEVMPVLMATFGKRLVGTLLGDCHPQRDLPRLINLWKKGELDLDALATGRIGLSAIDDALATARAGAGIRTVVDPTR